MSTNKNKHATPGHGGAPQQSCTPSFGQQRTQKDVNNGAGVNTGDQFLPPGTHRAPPCDHTNLQTSAYGAVPTLVESNGPVASNRDYRQPPPSAGFMCNTGGVQGVYYDNNNPSIYPDVDYGVQGIHNRAENIHLHLNWAMPSQPQLLGISGMMPSRTTATGLSTGPPSNNRPQQSFGSVPHTSSSGFGQHQTVADTPNQSSRHTSGPQQPGQQDVEMRRVLMDHEDQHPSTLPFGGYNNLGQEKLGGFSTAESFAADFFADPVDVEAIGAQAIKTAQMILRFEDLEDVDGFVLPDHSAIALAHATAAGAVQAVNNRFKFSKHYWISPKPDATLPRTHVQRQEVVRILLAAMKDTTRAIDKERRSFKKSWAPDAKEKHDDVIMEATCWKIALLTERLHVEGPTVLCVASGNALRTIKDSASFTFAQRIRYLVVLMSEFKARCEGLIKGTFLDTIVGNPRDALLTSRANFPSNTERQEALAYSREHRPNKRKRSAKMKSTRKTEDVSSDGEPGELTQSDAPGSTVAFSESKISRKRQHTSPRDAGAKTKKTSKQL